MLNKWKCSYSPLLHLNLNAVMWKLNNISWAAWGASGKHSWLLTQIKELRGFHCPWHFSQNFAALTWIYSSVWEQPDSWHERCHHLGSVTFPQKQSWQCLASHFPQLALELCSLWSHWEMVFHLKMPIFLCWLPTLSLHSVSTDLYTHRHIEPQCHLSWKRWLRSLSSTVNPLPP